MRRLVRTFALCGLAGLAIASVPVSAQNQLRGPISLSTPANDFTTFNVVSRLLMDADVPYGLEGPATDGGRAPIDFAQLPAPSGSTAIDTQSLDGALKQIAAINPRMRWSRQGALVVVRFGPERDGFLDQRVGQFRVNAASPRGALEALLTVLDPARASGFGVQGAGRPPAGREGETSARSGAPITLSLTDVTVLDVLNAIAAANGAMSWMVNYDPGRARYETATIQFIEGGYRVTALSKVSLAPPIPGVGADARNVISIPITGDLRFMLQSYAQQTGMRFGLEQVRGQAEVSRPSVSGVPPLTLPAKFSDDAVAQIVAFDSRYEWSQRNGFYRIRPKKGSPGRLEILDQPQSEFVAAGDSIDYVFDRIAGLLSGQPAFFAGSALPFGTNPISSRMALARVAPVTFTVPAGGTIADLLDALCLAEGTLSWQIMNAPSTPAPQTFAQAQLTISSPVGWSFGRSIRLSPESTSTVRSATTGPPLPGAFERAIGRLPLSFGPSTGTAFVALGAFARVPTGVEIYPALTPDDDPRAVRRPPAPVVLGPGSLSDAMHVLLERLPDYTMKIDGASLSIAPQKLLDAKTHFMNVPIDNFEVRDVSIYRAVTILRRRLNPAYVVGDWADPSLGPPSPALQSVMERSKNLYEKRVTLSVSNATPREILNRLIATHGELGWAVSYELPKMSLQTPVRIEEATCVIRLIPFAGTGFIADVPPASPPMAASPPPPMPTPAGGRVMVNLPLSAPGLMMAMSRLSTALSVPAGVEVLSGLSSVSDASVSPSAQAYDLTGLSMSQALAKLVEWMPNYAWTFDNGVYHVRPRAESLINRALDINVDRFSGKYADVRGAVNAIRDLIDARLPRAAPPPTVIGSLVASLGSSSSDLAKPIALDLTNVTVRQILDALVTQHGRLSWIVDARTEANGSATWRLRVESFGGGAVDALPIVR